MFEPPFLSSHLQLIGFFIINFPFVFFFCCIIIGKWRRLKWMRHANHLIIEYGHSFLRFYTNALFKMLTRIKNVKYQTCWQWHLFAHFLGCSSYPIFPKAENLSIALFLFLIETLFPILLRIFLISSSLTRLCIILCLSTSVFGLFFLPLLFLSLPIKGNSARAFERAS